MATCYINVGRKGSQRENWETEDPMADTLQRVAGGHGSKTTKPGANGEDKHNNLTTNVTYCTDISRKRLRRCIY